MIEESQYDYQNVIFLFSFSFSVLFLYFLQQSALLMLVFNLIYLPFNIIHELGHFCAIYFLLPMLNTYFGIYPIEEGICSCRITLEQLPASWESIISILAGSFFVIIFSLVGILILRKRTDQVSPAIKKFLIFGLIYDLTNLLPILPAMLGSVNDGYGISIILLRMGYSTYPSVHLSFLLSCLAAMMVILSYYYLGCFLYHLISLPRIKLQKQLNTLIESHGA